MHFRVARRTGDSHGQGHQRPLRPHGKGRIPELHRLDDRGMREAHPGLVALSVRQPHSWFMARDSIVASTDVGSPWRVRDNAIMTIAMPAVTAPAKKIATNACSDGSPVLLTERPSRTVTN